MRTFAQAGQSAAKPSNTASENAGFRSALYPAREAVAGLFGANAVPGE
ncbi:MAG: hypothetical protein Q4G71_07130 [Pseudomonadota bacterium]|nr:hypothetical protein [Pseudomonadota bacterium]